MTEINHQQILQLRTQMELELAKLNSETNSEIKSKLTESFADLSGEVADGDEDAYSDSMVDFDTAIIEMHLQKIDDLDAALMRIDTGEYGFCKDCGKEIKLARLKAYPTAKRCVSCQREYEKKHVL